jgi:hypothetical protein
MNEEIEEAVDDLINNFKRADVTTRTISDKIGNSKK